MAAGGGGDDARVDAQAAQRDAAGAQGRQARKVGQRLPGPAAHHGRADGVDPTP